MSGKQAHPVLSSDDSLLWPPQASCLVRSPVFHGVCLESVPTWTEVGLFTENMQSTPASVTTKVKQFHNARIKNVILSNLSFVSVRNGIIRLPVKNSGVPRNFR